MFVGEYIETDGGGDIKDKSNLKRWKHMGTLVL